MAEVKQITRSTKREDPALPALDEGIVRARSLVGMGLTRQRIRELTLSGRLRHLGRGLYNLPDSPVTENHDLARVAARVAQGVICLSSALQFHGLTTVSPWQVYLMLPHGGRPPRLDHPPFSLVYASGESYRAGIEEHTVEGISVKVTSIAKTVADCFKYRSKVGLDLALEALKQALDEERTTRAEIRICARICRVEKVMQPYVEALSV